jgi:hypothetical protein
MTMNRPTSVTVLGIVNIAFAVLGLLSHALMFALFSPYSQSGLDLEGDLDALGEWTPVTQLLGFFSNIVLLASGVGLLRMRPWGRYLAIIYAGYAIIAALGWTVYSVAMFESQTQGMGGPGVDERIVMTMAIIGGLIGLGISLCHPTLLLYFMTRRNVAAAFGESFVPTVEDTSDEPPPPLVSGNPYAAPATINSEASIASDSMGEQMLETVVPIKNGPALLSYYTGLFSLFPVFGLPLAIVAIISGRRGLSNAKANPQLHGKAHAWIGLACGWLFGLFNLVLVGLLGLAIVAAMMSGR